MTQLDAPSLFSRLLSTRASRRSKDGVKGHEEYLTQIMAFLLQQDKGLAIRWIRAWFKVPDATKIEVFPEDDADANKHNGDRHCTIDLKITFEAEGNQHRVYVENKVGAKLNQYDDGEGGSKDQAEVYAEQLMRVCGETGDRGHLILCALRPQEQDRTTLFTADPRCVWHVPKNWWDFYDVVYTHVDRAASGGEVRWLQQEFLSFCKEKRLSTPRAIRSEQFDVEDAARLLGLSAIASGAAGEIRVTHSKEVSDEGDGLPWATVYFTAKKPIETAFPRYWVSLTLEAHGIASRAYWRKVGELASPVETEFWDRAKFVAQRDRVSAVIRELPKSVAHFDAPLSKLGGVEPEACTVVSALREIDGVWVHPAANGWDIHVNGVNFPPSVRLVLGASPTTEPELAVYCGRSEISDALDTLIAEHLGAPERQTATYRLYPLAQVAERVEALARALLGWEAPA